MRAGCSRYRLIGFRRDLEDRQETRLVETVTVDVGVQLQAVGVAMDQDALGFLGGRIGQTHRQAADIAAEPVGVFGAKLGQAVIGYPGEFRRAVRAHHGLDGRQAER